MPVIETFKRLVTNQNSGLPRLRFCGFSDIFSLGRTLMFLILGEETFNDWFEVVTGTEDANRRLLEELNDLAASSEADGGAVADLSSKDAINLSSKDAITLLGRMVEPGPNNRPSLTEILQHPWLSEVKAEYSRREDLKIVFWDLYLIEKKEREDAKRAAQDEDFIAKTDAQHADAWARIEKLDARNRDLEAEISELRSDDD